MTLGQRIYQARKKMKYTQEEVAGIIGVSRPSVSQWERDKAVPETTKLRDLANTLNVSIAYLTGETDDPTPIRVIPRSMEDIKRDAIMHPFVDSRKNILQIASAPEYCDGHLISANRYTFIPVVELKACAGNGNGYAEYDWNETEVYPVQKLDIMGHAWQSENMRLVEVEGGSMEPKYHDGDLVLFVQGEGYGYGDIVIAIWQGRLFIRGYFPTDGAIELRPKAEGYSTIVIENGTDNFQIVGKVIKSYPKPVKELGFYN